MYRKVGGLWHLALSWAELTHGGTGSYGDGNYTDAGKVQVAESWAEYIGTDNANRRYGRAGVKFSSSLGQFINFPDGLEQEEKFLNDWIPDGFFYDLVDNVNTNTTVNENVWDNIGGANVHDMYDVFNSNTNSMCDYINQYISAYPAFNVPAFWALRNQYRLFCP